MRTILVVVAWLGTATSVANAQPFSGDVRPFPGRVTPKLLAVGAVTSVSSIRMDAQSQSEEFEIRFEMLTSPREDGIAVQFSRMTMVGGKSMGGRALSDSEQAALRQIELVLNDRGGIARLNVPPSSGLTPDRVRQAVDGLGFNEYLRFDGFVQGQRYSTRIMGAAQLGATEVRADYEVAGLTTFLGRECLVLNISGTAQSPSLDFKGHSLIDVKNGWALRSKVQMSLSIGSDKSVLYISSDMKGDWNSAAPTDATKPVPVDDIEDRLQRLKSMRDRNVIDEKEYETQRQRILRSL